MYYTGVFDFTDIVDMQKEIDGLEDKFANNLLKVATQVEDDYLPLLQQYPQQRAKHPFEFATPKSRRYYFYLVNSGQVKTDSYGYVRNGGYARSWNVDLEQNGTTYTLTVSSSFPAAQFVGGLRQVPGHANTGWIKFQPILADIDTFMEAIVKRLV